jgi:primosomal protein N'
LTKKGRKGLDVAPPQVLSLPRLRDKYRFVIVAKGKPQMKLAAFVHKVMGSLKRSGKTTTTVNINP